MSSSDRSRAASTRGVPTRRLFFALWPDRALQVELSDATRDIVSASGGRAVPVHNFHVTLAFLGSVPESELQSVERVAVQVAHELTGKRAQVAFDGAEYWKKARVICVTTSDSNRLHGTATLLADTLKAHLTAAGFAPDMKPFRPHVTLARNVRSARRVMDIQPVSWVFESFALVESRTAEQGSTYRTLATYDLSLPRDGMISP